MTDDVVSRLRRLANNTMGKLDEADVIEALSVELAAAEAEIARLKARPDHWTEEDRRKSESRNHALYAQVEAVRALHHIDSRSIGSKRPWCTACQEDWPCPTTRALGGFDD